MGSASLKLDREAEAFWICGIAMERLPSDGDKECAFLFPDDDKARPARPRQLYADHIHLFAAVVCHGDRRFRGDFH